MDELLWKYVVVFAVLAALLAAVADWNWGKRGLLAGVLASLGLSVVYALSGWITYGGQAFVLVFVLPALAGGVLGAYLIIQAIAWSVWPGKVFKK